ncbi:MAG TPA: 23S rRNA (adenine(2503)-C(2))-methyltransferase RlmN [Candidatus Merdenecus merdavium]|nr:23S rRNA (adenine(2503)-C(2))-methyltransferase RlmN [Candidatus Merdenecus merdavium]
MEKKEIKSISFNQLKKELEEMGEKEFRSKQIYEWIHVKLIDSFDEMTNLSKDLRERLKERYELSPLKMLEVQTSKVDGTQKFLFGCSDGHVVESVLMGYHHGNSVCISSQVGCRMGCTFCASTIGGLTRNLSPGEMLSQVYQIQKYSGKRVSNLVLMGTGEPLDNYDHVIQFVQMLSDQHGLHISQRNMTVSTCGLAPKIRELAKEGLQITLALSLHATTDEKRRKLMPIAKRYDLKEILEACDFYFETTGRRMTFEYGLVAGVNDRSEDAEELIRLVKHKNCHINLIPINPIKERDYVQSTKSDVEKFKNKLEKCGINVTIRREMGRDIDGACGQLRKRYMDLPLKGEQ